MLSKKLEARPSVQELCRNFNEIAAPLYGSYVGRTERYTEKVFFPKEELLGTEMPVWSRTARIEDIFPGGYVQPHLQSIERRRLQVQLRTRIFGETSLYTLWSRLFHAWSEFYGDCDTEDAFTTLLRDMQTWYPNEPTIVTIKSGLGCALLVAGKALRGKREFEEAMNWHRRMGKNENHPEMLENKVGVAGAHIHRREWTTAINVLLEVISSENTDQELPRHLQSHRQLVILEGKSFLANAYYESTKLENAKQVYEELCSDMGIPEDLLHKDHPDRLANLSGLGWVYYNLGMIKEAMSLFLEALPKQNIYWERNIQKQDHRSRD
jgi:tetratricopeptide (TPR) repeat protein